MPDNSVDSLVTDPPAGIAFMGKAWDEDKGGSKEWIRWMESVMRECLRVLKPGGHGLVWALPRTSHRTAMALEWSGFEIRDCVYHIFGSGFPKSLDVSKAIDKTAGLDRPVTGMHPNPAKSVYSQGEKKMPTEVPLTSAASPAAASWSGWGTALKPAVECWWLVQKTMSEPTVVENVMKWGVGALSIDASRIGASGGPSRSGPSEKLSPGGFNTGHTVKPLSSGRFPANFVLSHSEDCVLIAEGGSRGGSAGGKKHFNGTPMPDMGRIEYDDSPERWSCVPDCAVAELDRQSGLSKSVKAEVSNKGTIWGSTSTSMRGHSDSGGASRFFYCAKISRGERDAGAPETVRDAGGGPHTKDVVMARNHHPTVKPRKLMSYLIRLVTPPKGRVLDCFMGSGSTGCAAVIEGFDFVGIEREAEYFSIAKARIDHSLKNAPSQDADKI